MKRITFQKIQNFIDLYNARGIGAAVRTLSMKVFLYFSTFIGMQDIFFNIFCWRERTEVRYSINFYKTRIEQWRHSFKISIFLVEANASLNSIQDSVQSLQSQVYEKFEALLVVDKILIGDRGCKYLDELSSRDSRFKIFYLTEQLKSMSLYNFLLEISSGDFLTHINAGDKLPINSLYTVINSLNQNPNIDIVYSDDAQLTAKGWLTLPFFKPDWNPDSFLSRMYIGHFAVFRKTLVQQVNGYRQEYGKAQEYDLLLRLVEITKNISHIPKVLHYLHKSHDNLHSRAYLKKRFEVTELSAKAVGEALKRRGEPGKITVGEFASFIVRYEVKEYSKVSIIIPTRDLHKILDQCLESVFSKSTYPDFEVVLVDNGSQEYETFRVFDKWREREPNRFHIHKLDIPFNYSKLNNFAVAKSTGKYLLFLNNDIEVITPDWIEAMVEQAQRPSVGAVGALLLYPDNTIQHSGVVLGLGTSVGGAAGHVFCNLPYGEPGYFDQPNSISNYTALTAACLMCRRDVFEAVNGFEEKLAVAFNDTDLCLKIHTQGYRNVYLPHVVLYHYESKSRGRENTPEKKKRFAGEMEYLQSVWKHFIAHDPSYNQNLTKERSDFSFNINQLFNRADETRF